MSTRDREKVRQLVIQKMSKYVSDPTKDILFGSSRVYKPEIDNYVRQDLPQLIERMYENAGDLGLIVNIIDPAKKANEQINSRIYEIREQVARRIISGYATGCAWGSLLPYSSVTTTPLVLHSMNIAICKVMGVSKENTLKADKTPMSSGKQSVSQYW